MRSHLPILPPLITMVISYLGYPDNNGDITISVQRIPWKDDCGDPVRFITLLVDWLYE
jgi:hypothetical protein